MTAMTDFSRSMIEFQRRVGDEAVCAEYLAATRRPNGFACTGCGNGKAWRPAAFEIVREGSLDDFGASPHGFLADLRKQAVAVGVDNCTSPLVFAHVTVR
jgi:hypothetical protein